jgi:hypothetical protein
MPRSTACPAAGELARKVTMKADTVAVTNSTSVPSPLALRSLPDPGSTSTPAASDQRWRRTGW